MCSIQKITVNAALATQVLNIAKRAGAVIMAVYQEMRQSEDGTKTVMLADKADCSPLTKADILAHQFISKCLEALTPETPVVSEEDEHSLKYRQPTGDFWLVDPLDGTKEFLAQSGEFTVNIALVRNGKAILGVVTAPALGHAYWGAEGLGAFRETAHGIETIRVTSLGASGKPLRVIASKSHMNAETIAFMSQLGPCELVQAGSSLKFCRIAEGAADVYPRLGPTSEWDTAAAQAIVEAAGGHVSTLDGISLRYGKPDILNPYFVASSGPMNNLPGGSPVTHNQIYQ
jgi:3'(2'), 5'-bisphosphate nucleotidase